MIDLQDLTDIHDLLDTLFDGPDKPVLCLEDTGDQYRLDGEAFEKLVRVYGRLGTVLNRTADPYPLLDHYDGVPEFRPGLVSPVQRSVVTERPLVEKECGDWCACQDVQKAAPIPAPVYPYGPAYPGDIDGGPITMSRPRDPNPGEYNGRPNAGTELAYLDYVIK